MRQQWHNGIFNTRSERRPFRRPASQRFFTITDQELVEVMVGTNDGQISNVWSKQNLINISAKLDLPPQKIESFRGTCHRVGGPASHGSAQVERHSVGGTGGPRWLRNTRSGGS